MKKGIYYTIGIIIIILLLIDINLAVQKPKILYEESIDDNPIGFIDKLNKEFIIETNNDIGILIIHGLGASPYQTRDLANFLSEKNITVYSIRLSGHGTNLKDMEKNNLDDWYSDVEQGLRFLKEENKKICVLGVSAGAALSINLAKDYEIDCLILIAPTIYLKNKKIHFIPVLKYFQRYHYFADENTNIGYAYENLPTKSIAEFLKLTKTASKNLDKIQEPTLILQSKSDKFVDPKSSKYVFDNINSDEKEILWLEEINHAIIRTYNTDTEQAIIERKTSFEKIAEFLLK